MKLIKHSLTLKKTKSIQLLSSAIILINSVGVPTILSLVPQRYQRPAVIAITTISGIGLVFNVDGADKIMRERLLRGDLVKKLETEEERVERLLSRGEQNA